MLVASYFKLARIVRIRGIGSSIWFLFKNTCWRNTTEMRGSVYKRLIQGALTFFGLLHLMTCLWIWIGAIDADKENPQSWIFQKDSYFTGEDLTIYEQVSDPENTKIYPLYIYSVLYVMTAITTVGYGNHSYQTQLEYYFAIILEILSTWI